MPQSYDLNQLKLIDLACVEFEQQWSSETDLTEAKLSQILERYAISDREQLLSEMLLVSWSLVESLGQLVEPTHYLKIFTNDATVVELAYDRFCRERPPATQGSRCLPTGLMLGPYIVQERIGQGGMGDIYSANDSRLERPVAIKVLASYLTADENYIKRFSREAAAIGRLSHPNIVTLYDLGEAQLDSGQTIYFVVMELLEGQNLRECLKGGPANTDPAHLEPTNLAPGPASAPLNPSLLSPLQAVRIARDIAIALEAAHCKGIVHRDIKPENVFITNDGRVKVLDFGLARLPEATNSPNVGQQTTANLSALTPARQLTQLGTVMGTSGYMAPEQVRGEPATAASDIFGLCCILFEMLVGHPAFVGASHADIASATLRDDPLALLKPTGKIGTEQPWAAPLHRLLENGLQKEPAKRVFSAADLAEQLETIARQLSPQQQYPLAVAVAHDAASATVRLSRQRPPAQLVAVFGFIALLVAGAWIGSTNWNSSRTSTSTISPLDIAVLPFLATDHESADTTVIGLTLTLTDDLARSERLRVRPYSAVAHLDIGTSHDDPQLIKLNVDRLVTGRLTVRDGHHQLRVEIIDPEENRLVWSGSYDCPTGDLLKLQAKVRSDVFEHFGVAHRNFGGTRSPADANNKLLTNDLSAYESYVRAKMDLDTRSESSVNRAVRSFRESIRLDPNFVEAHTGLAQCCIILAERAIVPRSQALEMGLEAIERALELEPDNTEALVCRAMIRFEFQWEFDMAERDFTRALQLAPHNPLVRHWYAELLSGSGQPEKAIEQIEAAQQLDPDSGIIASITGRILFKAGRFDEAATSLEATLERHPEFNRARGYLLEVYEQQGRFTEALELWRQITMGSSGYLEMRNRFEQEGKAGYWKAQLENLDELRKKSSFGASL